MRTGVSLGDSVAGLYGAIGLLAALHEQRERPPGPGTPARIVDVALTESVLSLLEGMLPEYGALGRVRGPNGARIPTAAPSGAYRCADGAWIVIGGNSQPLWEKLAALMGRPELARDPRFADNPSRVRNVEALDAEIGAWVERHPAGRGGRRAGRGRHPGVEDLHRSRHRHRRAVPRAGRGACRA